MNSEEAKPPPHILIFPLPAQGNLNPMLNLAHLFCLSKFHVTFIVSEFSHRGLLANAAVASTFSLHAGFRFQPIPDGLPDDHPRAGDKAMDIVRAAKNTMGPLFMKWMIQDGFTGTESRAAVTCIVADGVLGFAADFAGEYGIPLVYFRTASVCYFWSLFCLGEVIKAQEIPFTENEMDELVKSVPGMEGFLRRRDLPSFCRVEDASDPTLQGFLTVTRETVRAQAVIFNTFEDLEGPMLTRLRNHLPRMYTIGPIHTHLKARLREHNTQPSVLSGGFWSEDRSCIDWLNLQPSRSVVYVSFGSITVMTGEQFFEFWHGLVNSGQRFLWVLRPDSVSNEDAVSAELEEGTKEKGMFVKWAPQEDVLNHPALGGFLTHSGWNSTLESIGAGVPMICWPYFSDQMVNSRYVSEVWKIGLDIKDTCDRVSIERAIREVMEVRKDEFLERVEKMSSFGDKAVSKGGSSYKEFDNLIEYIYSLIV